MNRTFILYQDEQSLLVKFDDRNYVEFQWDNDEEITKVIIQVANSTIGERNSEPHFEFALDFIKANSDIILTSTVNQN